MAAGVVLLTFRTQGTEAAAKKAGQVGESLEGSGKRAQKGAKRLASFTGELDRTFGQLVPFDLGLGRASGSLDKFAGDLDGAKGRLKLWGVGVAAAAGVAGFAVGAALSKSVRKAIELDGARREVQAQLGLTEAESKRIGSVAGKLYAGAYGDSIGQVADVVGQITQSVAGMSDATDEVLARTSRNIMNFAKGFEQDTARTTQIVGQMLTTGLAKDADQAVDLLTASMQKVPKNVRDDVVDAADEYGPFFAQLGLDGEQAFGLLVKGAEQGMYGIDKTGDALKELTIRATDMSKTSVSAYEAMGLDAQVMANKMLAGGETASAAFGDIVDGLLNIQDPSDQANAAIALMGTPLEDLGTAKIPGFLESLKGGETALGDFKGAADRLDESLNGGLSRGWDKLTRAWDGVFIEGGTRLLPLLDEVGDGLGDLAGWIQGHTPMLGDQLSSFIEWLTDIGTEAGPVIDTVIELWSAFSPLGLILESLRPVMPEISDLASQFGDTLGDLVDVALPLAQQVLPPLADIVSGLLVGAFQVAVPVVLWLVNALSSFLGWLSESETRINIVVGALAVGAGAWLAWKTAVGAISFAKFLIGMGQATAAFTASTVAKGKDLATTVALRTMYARDLVVGIARATAGLVASSAAWVANTAVLVASKVAMAASTTAQWLLNAAMNANPIMLVVTAIAALVGGLIWFFTQTEVGQQLWSAFTELLASGWQWVTDKLSAGWSWIKDNVFAPFMDGVATLGDSFEVAKDAIAEIWEGIKEAAAKPINFVLGTIWNDGLRSFWNDVVGALGLDSLVLPEAPLIAFAQGGVMPGYTPGRDVHDFYSPTAGRLALSGGEAIMRPEFTKAMGGAAGIERLNAAARAGTLDAAHFADGGVFGWASNIWGGIKGVAGDIWEGVKDAVSLAGAFLSDPAGAIQKYVIDGIIRPLMGDDGSIFKRLATSLPIELVKKAASFFGGGSVGTAGMGWEAMWEQIHSAHPDLTMTSNYRPNAMTVNGTPSYHGQGRAVDVIPASMDTFNKIAALFPNASELIYTPAGDRQLLNGQSFTGWSDAVKAQHYNHVHLAMKDGGIFPMLAGGGPVKKGKGYVVGDGGQPELFVPGESGYVYPSLPRPVAPDTGAWEAFADADVAIGRGPGGREVVRVITVDGKVLAEEVFDAAEDEEARL